MSEAKETYNELLELMSLVKDTDDYILNHARRLRNILFMLKIEGKRISDHNGIMPIADDLQKLINHIVEDISALTEKRNDLSDVLVKLKSLLNIDD